MQTVEYISPFLFYTLVMSLQLQLTCIPRSSTTVSCDLTGSPTATTGTCTWIFKVLTLAGQVSTPSFLTTYGSSELQIGSLTLAGAAAVTTETTTTSNVARTSKSGAKKTDVAMALVAGAAAGVGMLL